MTYCETVPPIRRLFAVLSCLLLAAVAAGIATSARAADAAEPYVGSEPVVEKRWHAGIALYGFMPRVDGDVAVFGLPETSVDASFSDIVDNLDGIFVLTGEVRYDRIGVFFDVNYLGLDTGSSPTPGPLFTDARVETTSTMLTGFATYRLLQQGPSYLDVMAGARYWHVWTRLSFTAGLLPAASRDDSANWVDAAIGLRTRYYFTDKFFAAGIGQVGAGGSDFMWDLYGALGYQFNDYVSVVAGYRGLGVDYSRDSFVYDLVAHGPVVGLVLRY